MSSAGTAGVLRRILPVPNLTIYPPNCIPVPALEFALLAIRRCPWLSTAVPAATFQSSVPSVGCGGMNLGSTRQPTCDREITNAISSCANIADLLQYENQGRSCDDDVFLNCHMLFV